MNYDDLPLSVAESGRVTRRRPSGSIEGSHMDGGGGPEIGTRLPTGGGAGQADPTIIENGLKWTFLAIRIVHLAQGVICVASGWSNYRRPRMAVAVLGLVGAESTWLLARVIRRRNVDTLAIRVDAAVGVLGLVGLASATSVEDRTTSFNWMLPYSVGTAVGLVVGVARQEGLVEVVALSGTYLATTVRPSIRPGQIVTALANAASYGGFHAVAATVVRRVRQAGEELAEAQAESAIRGERLLIERERNRQHRLLHDSALQTLEGVANGLIEVDESIRGRARAEARRLRQALSGIEPEGDLADSLDRLAAEFASEGLEVTCTLGATSPLRSETTLALADAVREALRNVAKYAGTPSAVIRAEATDGGMTVTVRDQGRGFDTDAIAPGFGLSQSVHGRLEEVDGKAEIWSRPGRGTRVTLWVPAE
jgi:signal transduction histidine kinase